MVRALHRRSTPEPHAVPEANPCQDGLGMNLAASNARCRIGSYERKMGTAPPSGPPDEHAQYERERSRWSRQQKEPGCNW